MGSLRKQFHFTMFYTLTTVFAFMNSTIYWFITRAHSLDDDSGNAPDDGDAGGEMLRGGRGNIGAPCEFRLLNTYLQLLMSGVVSDLFGEGWYKPFVIFNFYAVTSGIMVYEILFLNSIRRPFVRCLRLA